MRIDDLNRTPLTQGTEKTDASEQKHGAEKAGSQASGADQADVSALAQALSTHDAQRLEHLRLEVQSGKYQVSPEALAKAIIEAHSKE